MDREPENIKDRSRARRPAIAVCGASQASAELQVMAREVGRRIVEAGCTLVCGGMFGVMEAACRGGQEGRAQGATGVVLGILPGPSLDGGNPYCDVVVATGMGYTRNALVVLAADAVILVGGGSGTLSEAAYAWQFGKPVVALAASGGWAARLAGTSLDEKRTDLVLEAGSVEEAVDAALRAAGSAGA
jgi:uncharacterized protein (TIGR00725 family)